MIGFTLALLPLLDADDIPKFSGGTQTSAGLDSEERLYAVDVEADEAAGIFVPNRLSTGSRKGCMMSKKR